MSELKVQQLLKEFDLNKLKPVIFIYGNEDVTKNLFIEKVKSVLATTVFWGDELDFKTFLNEIGTKSLFATERVIVVRQFEDFVENLKKEELKIFLETLKKITLPKRLILITSFEKIPSSEPYKTLVSLADVLVSNKLSSTGFYTSIKNKLQREGKVISEENLQYLVSLLNNDLTLAKNEIEKLLLYTADKKEITKEDIDAVVTPKFEENVFVFLNNFFKKDKIALKQAINLIENGAHPFEIQSLILSQLEKALYVKSLLDEGIPIEEAFSKVGITVPIQKSNISNILKSRNETELQNLLKSLYSLELQQKVFYQDPTEKFTEFLIKSLVG